MKRIIFLVLCFLVVYILWFYSFNKESYSVGYVGADTATVVLYDAKYNESINICRGDKIFYFDKEYTKDDMKYYKIQYNKNEYFIQANNIVKNYEDVVYEKNLYVRTKTTLYKNKDDASIDLSISKGEMVEVVGFDFLSNGIVHKYQVNYNGKMGYVYAKYLVPNHEESLKNYDEEGIYQIHLNRDNRYGGGSGGTLDYYPYEKVQFDDNIMPEEVRSLYLNAGVLNNIDAYIELAKQSGINAFVVDIKDGTVAYPSMVTNTYSPSNYAVARNSLEVYQSAIKKLKDNGFYVIGRIVAFKDYYYAIDHPEDAIISKSTGELYMHNDTYWPSPYIRNVWEYNVNLAIEAVRLMGFNEIQFDYVRFPDRTYSLEQNGVIDFKNIYNEEKAEAIQGFLFYATDTLHEENVYVSVDVFGESAHAYVTGYGQYFPAISNIVDVVSAMPYPDHFNKYDYGLSEISWTIPYQLLYTWGSGYVMKRQAEIPTPARLRTWIQAYNTIREPYIVYDSVKIEEQIRGLYDAGLTGGFITWNSSSSLDKYTQISSAFGKEY